MNERALSYTKEEAEKYRGINETTQSIDVYFAKAFTDLDISGQKILDYGCGMGHMIPMLASFKVGEVVGCDPSIAMIEEAKKKQDEMLPKNSATKVRFEYVDTIPLPYSDASFDGILCRYVFHYILDTESVLKELFRVLKPGGWLTAIFSDVRFDQGYENLANTEIPLNFSNTLTVTTLAKPGIEIRDNAVKSGFKIKRYESIPKEKTTVIDHSYKFRDHLILKNGFLVAFKP